MQSLCWLLRSALAILLSIAAVQAQPPAPNGEKSHSTSVAGMVELLQLETKLIENLNDYATELELKLATVRSAVAELRAENEKAQGRTAELYLSNPLNAFKLIRRMQRDWIYWQLYMEQPVATAQVEYLKLQLNELPSSTDLEEAAVSIQRLQTTYDLKVDDMASGLLNGKQYNVSFSALDTYALGLQQYDEKSYDYASMWLFHAINWLKQRSLPALLGLQEAEVLQLYAETLVKLNRFADALKVYDMAQADKGRDGQILRRKAEIETMIRTEPNAQPIGLRSQVLDSYKRGCRGLYPVQSKLHCSYNFTTTPFLRLAPLKMELVQLDPYMVLYHDVISSSEIRALQSMAKPGLKRATVFKEEIGQNQVVKTRTSKFAWFPDSFSDLTIRLNRRIADMTGFDMYGSEMLQVMNYGLGGHYDKHYDFFNVSMDSDLTRMNGDRIATVLFYLNDVEQGGATVFPNINQAVFPQRGTAIIWYNLNNEGQGDWKTLHAACPVLVGSKWVCNKWIREHQQLFKKPCFKH